MTSRIDSAISSSSPASEEIAFQFLQLQIGHVTSHLQIADGKAAGLITYISAMSAYTATRIDFSAGLPSGFAVWLALVGGGIGLVALATAFLAVMPRGWSGSLPDDPFSWIGLSSAASPRVPYVDRLPQLTFWEMQRALADTVETCAFILKRKYRLVYAAIIASIASTVLQVAYWLIG